MKSELLAESKQNHLKTRAEIKRNTNADGAKTRKDISAQLSKMQKEYAVNLEQMERNLQRTIRIVLAILPTFMFVIAHPRQQQLHPPYLARLKLLDEHVTQGRQLKSVRTKKAILVWVG